MTTPKKFAIIGDPITHSLSPFIHQQFAKLAGISISYTAECVTEAKLGAFLQRFAANGGIGLNVTAPLKQTIIQYASQLSESVNIVKAANTVSFLNSGAMRLDNTDGEGLVRDLNRLKWQIQNARILIMGAGGVVAGIIPSLLQLNPRQMIVINRNFARAQALVTRYASPILSAQPWEISNLEPYDIVFHAMRDQTDNTSQILSRVINSYTKFYDINYGRKAKSLMELAKNFHPLEISDGLGMLVYQAAESFNIWHGINPSVDDVLQKCQFLQENSR